MSLRRLEKIQKRLVEVTHGCRFDMHEPDEQGVYAVVSGFHLDNAFGGHTSGSANCGELTVAIWTRRRNPLTEDPDEWFNLADLIAIARAGSLRPRMEESES